MGPYGGTARIEIPTDQREAFEGQIIPAANLSGAAVRRSGDHTLLVREGALVRSGDWSHSETTPGNAGASQDHFVKAPLGLLWFDGSIRWHRKSGAVAVRVVGGRVFLNADPLIAVDAYTGRHLWELKLPPSKTRDNLIALEDAVYVVGGKSCRRIDPATGEWNGEIPLPAEIAALPGAVWRNVKIQGDFLVGTSGNQLLCVDRHDGSLHWKFECGRPQLDVAVGSGRVFCAELMNPKRGEKEGRTLAFDIATGARFRENNNGAQIRFRDSQDYLVTEMGIYAAGDGTRIRDGGKDLVVAGVRLISGKKNTFTLFDLSTGAKTAEQLPWNRRGCTELRYSPNIATTRYQANAAYIDLDTKEVTPLWNMRSACNNNLFPANGVLSIPNLTGGCTCNYTPTSLSFAPQVVLERSAE